jgi:hypothetical protein
MAVDQRLDRRGIVHIQVGAPAARVGGQGLLMRAAPSSVVAVPTTW